MYLLKMVPALEKVEEARWEAPENSCGRLYLPENAWRAHVTRVIARVAASQQEATLTCFHGAPRPQKRHVSRGHESLQLNTSASKSECSNRIDLEPPASKDRGFFNELNGIY